MLHRLVALLQFSSDKRSESASPVGKPYLVRPRLDDQSSSFAQSRAVHR